MSFWEALCVAVSRHYGFVTLMVTFIYAVIRMAKEEEEDDLYVSGVLETLIPALFVGVLWPLTLPAFALYKLYRLGVWTTKKLRHT